ncbi:prefoldin subunit beta [Candidatus Bathyarchaeota archaeon]|nr:prefoldin subunit beta [Candidatus Bathyarchaeota archaeon]
MDMAEMEQLPPEVQERIARLQQLQSMLQSLVLQRQRVDIELNETERALKALEKVLEGSRIFKSVGSILVEMPKDEVVRDLTERKELLEIRSKALEKQENKARERLASLQEALQRDLGLKPPQPGLEGNASN